MKQSIKNFLFLLMVTMAFPITSAKADVQVGSPAPNFSLVDSHGKTHSLKDFSGKYVVLEWTNHQCPYVKKHYNSQNMQKLQKKYKGQGVVWLSVVSSAPGKQGHVNGEQANQIAKERGAAPTAILLDADGKVGKLYGAKTTPHMFVIEPKGTLIYMGAIDDKPSFDVADVATAQNYVVAALEQHQKGEPVKLSASESYGCSVKY